MNIVQFYFVFIFHFYTVTSQQRKFSFISHSTTIQSTIHSRIATNNLASLNLTENNFNASTQTRKPYQSLFNHFKTNYLKKVDYKNYYILGHLNRNLSANMSNFSRSSTNTTFGGSYYLVGVIFMVFIIGLLIYVNLCNEICLKDTCVFFTKFRVCICLKLLFKKKNNSHASNSHYNNYQNQSILSKMHHEVSQPTTLSYSFPNYPNEEHDYNERKMTSYYQNNLYFSPEKNIKFKYTVH